VTAVRPALRVLVVAVPVAAAAVLLAPQAIRPPWHFFDLLVYRGAIQWWAGGHSLYTFQRGTTGYGFTYPPFAAVALAPLALGRWRVQAGLLTAASVAVVVATTLRFVDPVARRAGWRPAVAGAVAVPAVLMMDPVRETLAFGQINLLLVALVLADFVALRRGWWWAGVGTGLATAIKLTPAVFVLYFLVTRRWRPAVVAGAAFLAASAAAFVVSPSTSVEFWTSTLWDTARIGRVDKTSNQSLMGMLARLAGQQQAPHLLWLLLVAAVLVLGLWRARQAFVAGDELTGLTLTGLTGVLISPISWNHHLYWLVPAVLVLVDVAVGRSPGHAWPWSRLSRRGTALVAGLAAAAVTVACWTSLNWHFQRDQGLTHPGGVLGTVGENSFVLIMLALLVLLPVREPVPAGSDPADDSPAALAVD
jgi:alpha-1,2-mannosyltransferase